MYHLMTASSTRTGPPQRRLLSWKMPDEHPRGQAQQTGYGLTNTKFSGDHVGRGRPTGMKDQTEALEACGISIVLPILISTLRKAQRYSFRVKDPLCDNRFPEKGEKRKILDPTGASTNT